MTAGREVTVVGAGAIGGFVAACLCAAGIRATVSDSNQQHIAAIARRGLRVTGALDLLAHPYATEPEGLPYGLKTVLLAVKASDTEAALDVIAPRLAPDGCVVSLQNGLGVYTIAARVGDERTVGAFLTFGGHYVSPGEVLYGGAGSLRIGELDGSITERVRELVSLLSNAHPAEATANIHAFIWAKVALGAFYFATALADADVPEVIGSAPHRQALQRLVGEVASIAYTQGIECESVDGFFPDAFRTGDQQRIDSSWRAQLEYWGAQMEKRTGIWRDLAERHRPTEVGGILGLAVERARARQLSVPLLTRTIELVREVEAGTRPLGWGNLDDLARLVESP
ncbi:MAG TPA: 2-dehydropantoate 2-reductase [Chloroflexi bacterium]|nr:2-dehydropantoate 2-reductase [Chloroflexota bacterium]